MATSVNKWNRNSRIESNLLVFVLTGNWPGGICLLCATVCPEQFSTNRQPIPHKNLTTETEAFNF